MSVLKVNGLGNLVLGKQAATSLKSPWVKNPSWSTLPTVTSAEQKVVGLVAIFPGESNFISFLCSGAYTVDWGDGQTENVATATQANYQYFFDSPALANTNAPVTFTDATDIVNRTSHGYTNGNEVKFYNISGTTGINEGQIYYVINATANTFQVSNTINGSAITLTNDGSATLLPYKQAIITITPQAGQNLTSVNLKRTHPTISSVNFTHNQNWLDLTISLPNATSLTVGGASASTYMRILERLNILNLGSITNISNLCGFLNSLRSVSISNTSSVTNMSSLFSSCYSLENAPTMNTASVTNMSSMFATCYSLTNVPLYNTASVTNMQQMFENCFSLKQVPAFNTQNVTNMSSMFSGCGALRTLPVFNTAKVTTLSSAFRQCYSLSSVPQFNTSNVTVFTSTFYQCFDLETVPLLNTSKATAMDSMFSGCYNLSSVPLFDTANVTNMSATFRDCYALTSVPKFNTANVTNMSQTFYFNYSLVNVPEFNTTKVTDVTNMFAYCYSLDRAPQFNTANVTTMSDMFNTCRSLEVAPYLNTSKATTISGMFSGCESLSYIPTYDTSNVTSFVFTFNGCTSLGVIPSMNVSKVSSSSGYSGMFTDCRSLGKINATSFNYSFSVANANLSANSLNEIYTNLPVVSSQTITVTGNYGVNADNTVIATSKGWTVTG